MKERTEGILKITEGWVKRVIGITPVVLAVASLGTTLSCAIAGIVKDHAIIGQYKQSQSYVDHINTEKEKLLQELSAGMPWQDYNKKIKDLEGDDYAREFLKTTDENFNKDYKLVDNLNLAAAIGFGVLGLTGGISLVQGFTVDDHDSFWFESAEDDIDYGEKLLEKAWLAKTTLPPDENNFSSIEEEYK